MHLFSKYIVCASVALLADASLFLYLVNNYDSHYLIANTISVFIGAIVNFLLVRNFVFGKSSRFNDFSAFILTIIVSFFALIVNNLSLFIFHDVLLIGLLFAKLLASFAGLIINFLLRRDFVFK